MILCKVPLVGVQRHSTLGSLTSPVFRPKPEDNWSPMEIGLFESAMCNYGKNFNAIQRNVSGSLISKLLLDCVRRLYLRLVTEQDHEGCNRLLLLVEEK